MRATPGGHFIFLLSTMWKYANLTERRKICLCYAGFIAANIIASLQPFVFARLITAAQGSGSEAMYKALILSIIYGGISILFWFLNGPSRFLERNVAFNVNRVFTTVLFQIITEKPLRWHHDHHSGSTINRIRKAERALFQFAQTQYLTIQIMVRAVTSIVMLAFFSVGVTVVTILASVFIIMLTLKFDQKIILAVRQTNKAEHHLSSALYDYIGNIITVLTLRMQRNVSNEIQSRYEGIKRSFGNEIIINEGKWAFLNIALITSQIAIIAVYIIFHMGYGQTVALGNVVGIFQYLFTIMLQFVQGSQVFGQHLYHSIDVHGVDDLIEDPTQQMISKPAMEKRQWKEIDIKGLTFTHHQNKDTLHHLYNFDLKINAGNKIALVGPSGSGKSTLLTLLRGLHEAQSVNVSIDEENFDDLTALAPFTTLVSQESELFENTVLYNLTFDIRVPEDLLLKALSVSVFDEVLKKLPGGLTADLRERGINLSGGQKQRLALARGLIAAQDSTLLLLDEPTSNIDQKTEKIIFDRLFHVFADKAIIATVHRLHLLPRFDHVVLLHEGTVVEQGSFSELLTRQGHFARLWNQQFDTSMYQSILVA